MEIRIHTSIESSSYDCLSVGKATAEKCSYVWTDQRKFDHNKF